MNRSTHPNQHRGFTMVELLAVIAILGLLAGILVPTITGAQKKAKQNIAQTNLKSITTAFITYNRVIGSTGKPEDGGASSVAEFAEVLARSGDLRMAKPWYIDGDQKEPQGQIPMLVRQDGTNQLQSVRPAGWAVVLNAKKAKYREPTYPLFWTRGLQTDGEWNESTAPWGNEGGHVAFGDGHVAFYRTLAKKGERFIKADDNNGTETSNYQEAIGTTVSGDADSSPTMKEDSI